VYTAALGGGILEVLVRRAPAAEVDLLHIEVDWDRCTGNGLCEFEAEKYFEVQDDGSLQILRSEVEAGDEEQVRNAVHACPTEALSLGE
jgi:ferredoxin